MNVTFIVLEQKIKLLFIFALKRKHYKKVSNYCSCLKRLESLLFCWFLKAPLCFVTFLWPIIVKVNYCIDLWKSVTVPKLDLLIQLNINWVRISLPRQPNLPSVVVGNAAWCLISIFLWIFLFFYLSSLFLLLLDVQLMIPLMTMSAVY